MFLHYNKLFHSKYSCSFVSYDTKMKFIANIEHHLLKNRPFHLISTQPMDDLCFFLQLCVMTLSFIQYMFAELLALGYFYIIILFIMYISYNYLCFAQQICFQIDQLEFDLKINLSVRT